MPALTLLEASKLNTGTVKRGAVIEMFAASSDVLRVMPWVNISGGALAYNQEGTLPAVAFRGFNEAYTPSAGVINPAVETLRIAGGELDVDTALIKTRGPEIRSSQEAMKIKALALNLGKKVIKGDSSSDPKEFDGLQVRTLGNQIVDAGSTNGGDPLSLNKLDEAIDACDSPTHLIMSKAMRRRLNASARATGVGGFITWQKDEFGQSLAFYNDLPILISDYDETGARILGFDEVGSGGSTATATSIYVTSFGENMLTGIQNGEMEVTDLKTLQSQPVMRTRIEWLVGMAALHGRSVTRLRGISNAAVVA